MVARFIRPGALVMAIASFWATGQGAQAASDSSAAAPQRIIAVGGAVTEMIFLLGAQDRLIAVDSTSQYPEGARALPNIGYMRQLAAEPILALSPDLVLAVGDAGPPKVLEQLRAAGIELHIIADTPTSAGVIAKLTAVAEAVGAATQGEILSNQFRDEFTQVQTRIARLAARPRVLFLLYTGGGPMLLAGRDTSAAGIITLAGGRNALESVTGYKPLSPEALAEADPDVLLVTKVALDRIGADRLLSRPDIALTRAGREKRLIAMDALLLLGFGPRTPEAIRELATALHGETAFEDISR